MDILIKTILKLLCFLAMFGGIWFLTRLVSSMLPAKYRDGKIAPKQVDQPHSSYVQELDEKLKRAGVETERDLL